MDYIKIGKAFADQKRFKDALDAFTNAEQSSLDGKNPKASLLKGIVLLQIKEFRRSISSLIKAEYDSPNQKNPLATYCRGMAHLELNEYETALKCFIKAEQDNFGKNIFESALYKGRCYSKLGEYEKAIATYTQAENYSEGVRPQASLNKGAILCDNLNRYEDALESFAKALRDNGGTLPHASFNMGLIYIRFKKFEKAVECFKKAEIDSQNGKFPTASYYTGRLLHEIWHQYKDAISSYMKAEEDSPQGKHPLASLNKGRLYKHLEQNNKACISFKKAISDSKNQYYPEAYLELSKILLLLDDSEGAYKHAFISIFQDDRSWKIVEHIINHFSRPETLGVYKNRLQYIELLLSNISIKIHNEDIPDSSRGIIEIIVKRNSSILQDNLYLFTLLLREKSVVFPNNIAYQSRLKLAYLIHYINGEMWDVFYIIDELLRKDYVLNEMDYHFYILSAYEIGEPKEKLRVFTEINHLEKDSYFGEKFYANSERLKYAIDNVLELDPYLVNCIFDKEITTKEDKELHAWIVKALRTIADPTVPYVTPINEIHIKGLLTQLIEYNTKEQTINVIGGTAFRSFEVSLNNGQPTKDTIHHIRQAIKKDGVSYKAILAVLLENYYFATDEKVKNKLLLIAVAAIFSDYADFKKKSIIQNGHTEVIVGGLTDANLNAAISTALTLSVWGSAILSIGVGFFTKYSFEYLNQNREARNEEFFNKIIEEIDNVEAVS